MMNLNDLKRKAARDGVPQGIIEKDFALTVALGLIADSDLAPHLIFKGGTAIKKIYFADARFSEDLDFTAIRLGKDELVKRLSKILQDTELEGVRFGKAEREPTKEGLKAAVKYLGPLGYEQRIRFDFSFRNNLVQPPETRQLIDPYGTNGGKKIFVLPLKEIFAEKIHALGSRKAPRDLYDAWFLFERGVRLDAKTVNRKFSYYKEKFDKTKTLENALSMKTGWKRDLQPFVKTLPGFDSVYEKVKEKLDAVS